MNTTTNTRGVSEAMVEEVELLRVQVYDLREANADLRERNVALEAALSAPEPAAQGEEFDPRKWVRHMADVLEAGGDVLKVDADLARLGAAICAITAPPAQPDERVPEGWKQAAEWLRNNYQDHPNIASLIEAMLTAQQAAR